MAAKSNKTTYGAIAVLIHWVTVLLIITLLATGFRLGMTDNPVSKTAILRVHIPAGGAVFLLTLMRLIWWRFFDQKPKSLPMPNWQGRSARAVHVVFYIVILAMAFSGFATIAISGVAPIIFGQTDKALPDFWNYSPRLPHGIGARLLIGLITLHVFAALYHQFVVKDGLLRRMWFRRTK